MLRAWRIVKEKYAAMAFSGEGAAEFGGRWNLPGTKMAYTSESQSLATIELLVHLNPPHFSKYKAIGIQFEEGLTESLSSYELPPDWNVEPPSLLTQRLGSLWAAELRSVVLAVPSAIVPEETNYLVNPLHPDFSRIEIGPARDFALDSRLF